MKTNGSATGIDWEALRTRTDTVASSQTDAEELARVFRERAIGLARRVQSEGAASHANFLRFVHASMTVALELSSVLRVLSPRKSTLIPCAPAHLTRVLYDSGQIISVLDLAVLMGRAEAPKAIQPFVLLRVGQSSLALGADQVLGTASIDVRRLAASSPVLNPNVARAVRGVADDMTVVLDGPAILKLAEA